MSILVKPDLVFLLSELVNRNSKDYGFYIESILKN